MAGELGHNPQPLTSEVQPSVDLPESSTNATTKKETVLYDSTRDTVGAPDFAILAKRASFLNKYKAARDPSQAEYYVPEGSSDYPVGFQEPKPFAIDGREQWEIYLGRKEAIEKRLARQREEELQGVPLE